MKAFIKKVKQLGWELDHVDVALEAYTFTKSRGRHKILFRFYDDEFVELSSVLQVSHEVEDYAKLEEMLLPYIEREKQKMNLFDWDGELQENIKIYEYYELGRNEDSPKHWDEIDDETIEEMIGEHMSYVRRMKSTLTRLSRQVCIWQAYHFIDPKYAIRIPIGRIHSAYPSLKDALDQYIKETSNSCINEDEPGIINNFCFWIGEIALYNPCYRNVLREQGVDALVEKICEDEPRFSKEMVSEQVRESLKYRGNNLKDYDIRYMGLRESVKILGLSYVGTDDFIDGYMGLHVAYACKPYPCFDEFDVLYESRFYQAWAFSSEKITDAVRRELHELVETSTSFDRLGFDPTHVSMVYDKGDMPVAYLITKRKE